MNRQPAPDLLILYGVPGFSYLIVRLNLRKRSIKAEDRWVPSQDPSDD